MEKILKFWFGYNQTSDEFNKQDYKHKPQLWFKLSTETDQLIRDEFSSLLADYENKQLNLNPSNEDTKSSLALLILLDQLSQFINRGNSKMFYHKQEAVNIAKNLLNYEDKFTSIEKYFIYLCLLNDEDKQTAQIGLDCIKSLHENETNLKHKQIYLKYYQTAQKTFTILTKFNRYPQRNELLNRESTKDELEFLIKSTHSYAKIVKKKEVNHKKPQEKASSKSKFPVQHILYLHGYRQSSNKIKKRLLFPLVRPLLNGSNVRITFLNGTHPFRGDNINNEQLNKIESQRVWYNLHNEDDEHKWDSISENELSESLAYVVNNSQTADGRPIYDGIIGFSQGAVLASILVKKFPTLFRYFISISGYKITLPKYVNLLNECQIDLPSLHIYGVNDKMVDLKRSLELSDCFKNSLIKSHSAGHFAPDFWPIDEINKFVLNQSKNLTPLIKSFNHLESNLEALKLNINEINFNLLRFNLNDLNLESLFSSEIGLNLYNSIKNIKLELSDEILNEFKQDFNKNDKLILIHYLLIKNKSLKMEKRLKSIDRSQEEDKSIKLILKLWTQLYSKEENFTDSIDIMFIQTQNWYELVYLADLVYEQNLMKIYQYLIDKFCYQLIFDLKVYDFKRNKHNLEELISNLDEHKLKIIDIDKKINNENDELTISNLAFYFPRIKSSLDKRSRIAKETAIRFNKFDLSLKDSSEKILSYNHFRKILSTLTYYLKHNNINETTNPRVYFNLARSDTTALQALLKSNVFSDAILNPVPEPVDISSREYMQPLFDWLNESSSLNKLTESDLKFLRGTITRDGRLDLCKQVIGPQGVEPLLDSMKNNKHVNRLLLGNNIIGDDGAELIADFIKSGKSNITIWYIAGNKITSNGISKIVNVLINDTQVTGLWLKRNPLKSDGMIPLSNLLTYNTRIQVLDLLNCGLLDSGVDILFQGLKLNQTLKHLYLSANGITPKGIESMLEYFKHVKESQLETLFLGCNRIGDEGARLIGECLHYAPKLENLNLTSSRIGPIGMKYLCEKLRNNFVLKQLDLGYMRATMDLGELNNYIQDEGVYYLSDLLKSNQIGFVSLNLTHNHISQTGFDVLVDAIKSNSSLIYLNFNQFGVHFRDESVRMMKTYLKLNEDLFLKNKTRSDLEAILIPEHVKDIYSVYRTH